jgi:murein DD-endopeptidase MepM/ murein hydrolase activator NlpD
VKTLGTVTRRRFFRLGVQIVAPLGLLLVATPSVTWATASAPVDPPTGISSLEEALRLGIARSNAAPTAEDTATQAGGAEPEPVAAEHAEETPPLEEPPEDPAATEAASEGSLPVDGTSDSAAEAAGPQSNEGGPSAADPTEPDTGSEREVEPTSIREESNADSDDASEADTTRESDDDGNDRGIDSDSGDSSADNFAEERSDEETVDEIASGQDDSDEGVDNSSGAQGSEESASDTADESVGSEIEPPESDGYQHEAAREETESAQASASSVSGEVGDDWERADDSASDSSGDSDNSDEADNSDNSDNSSSDDFLDSVQWPFFGIITTYFMEVGPYSPRGHAGIDIAGPYGSPVVAMADGTVTVAGWAEGYGITLVIAHGDGYSSRYAHLDSMEVGYGDRVDGGDVIGYVGTTGYSTGPHLHLEVREHGALIDPLLVLP